MNNLDNRDFKTLFERLDKLETDISELTQSMQELKDIMKKDITPKCSKMESHIDFIEEVYATVKSPLYFICNKVNRMTGKSCQPKQVEP